MNSKSRSEGDCECRRLSVAKLVERFPELEPCESSIADAAKLLIRCYTREGTVLTCGNGGSAADSGHIVGELMKGFRRKRQIPDGVAKRFSEADGELAGALIGSLQEPLPAIDLTAQSALISAFVNDRAAVTVYAQQVLGYSSPENLLIAISTSGNSRNVVYAAFTARTLGLAVIGLTGRDGGDLSRWCDVCISVPADETALVQELHLPVYHALCEITEYHFFAE